MKQINHLLQIIIATTRDIPVYRTLPETNIAPEDTPQFSGAMLVFGGVPVYL